MTLLIFAVFCVLSYALGYYVSKYDQEDKVSFEYMKSELSDPSINIPPYGFYAPHYRLLDNISYYSGFGTPEFTSLQIKNWEKSNDRRAGELVKMGLLNVRSEKTLRGKRNYYSINSKARKILLQLNNKF